VREQENGISANATGATDRGTQTTMSEPTRDDWIRRARRLAIFTIGYNLVEGVVSIGFGAEDESLALLGFGSDSFIEMASAFLVLWRLKAEVAGVEHAARRERIAGMAVSALLLLLAAGTIAASIWQLTRHDHPATTLPGTIIAALSLSFMFWLWRAKVAVAAALGSRTLRQDATCSLGCINLSATLLVGSLLYLVLPGWWWADSAAAIAIALFIGREGREGFHAARRGETCGCGHDL
jgi:divalent metal cation (Fe/Co/Zn/Cd) transporter